MIIPVHMFAFYTDRSKIRHVAIPIYGEVMEAIDHDPEALNQILDSVFKFGQNDFQPQDLCSVSVGDVIELKNRYFMVASVGFKELSKAEFEALTPPTYKLAYE